MDRWVNWAGRAVIIFLYLPIAVVVIYSFSASSTSTEFKGFTFHWYQELAQNGPLIDALQTSLLVGAISATSSAVIGLMAALAFARKDAKARTALLGAFVLPIIVPEIVLGAALLSLFSAADVTLGMTTIVLSHIVITLPMSTLVMVGAVGTLDSELSEAAEDLGCTAWETFRRVTLPLLFPSVIAAWLLSFITSFGNIVLSTFTNGVGSTTLPLRVYSLLKTGLTPEINALGSVLIMATAAIVVLIGVREVRRVLAPSHPSKT